MLMERKTLAEISFGATKLRKDIDLLLKQQASLSSGPLMENHALQGRVIIQDGLHFLHHRPIARPSQPLEQNCQLILAKDLFLTKSIMVDIHNQHHRKSDHYVACEYRKKYHTPRDKELFGRLQANCATCRRLRRANEENLAKMGYISPCCTPQSTTRRT